jgi:HSP20 family protein
MFPIPSRKDLPGSLSELQAEMNNLFQRLWHAGVSTGPMDGMDWAPVLDALDEGNRYVVRAEVPGLEASDIEVSYAEGTLTVRGHKKEEYTDETRAGLIRHERRFGQFARSLPLPGAVEASKISATCRNGVLEITLQKKEDSRTRTVKIEVSG